MLTLSTQIRNTVSSQMASADTSALHAPGALPLFHFSSTCLSCAIEHQVLALVCFSMLSTPMALSWTSHAEPLACLEPNQPTNYSLNVSASARLLPQCNCISLTSMQVHQAQWKCSNTRSIVRFLCSA